MQSTWQLQEFPHPSLLDDNKFHKIQKLGEPVVMHFMLLLSASLDRLLSKNKSSKLQVVGP